MKVDKGLKVASNLEQRSTKQNNCARAISQSNIFEQIKVLEIFLFIYGVRA